MPLIRNIHDEPKTPVEMDGVENASMRVMIGRGDGAPHFALRAFTLGPGGHTPRHAHDYEHEVYIVSGKGSVLLEGDWHDLRAGDTIYVPANGEHQFRVDPGHGEPMEFLCAVPVEQNRGGAVPGS